MPHHKSARKRLRQDKKRALANKAVKSQIKTAARKLKASGSAAQAGEALRTCSSLLDRAVKKSVLHRGTADRTKSRLARAAARMAGRSQTG
ncbi:MAG: 30S ribosomal protein S20 [Candidatus Eisenbacteria bacterium]